MPRALVCSIALTAGLLMASAPDARAQVAYSIGSPYPGTYLGTPGLGYVAPSPLLGTTSYYSSGYSGLATPLTPVVGLAPTVGVTSYRSYAAPAYGIAVPAYRYPAYEVYRYRRPGLLGRIRPW